MSKLPFPARAETNSSQSLAEAYQAMAADSDREAEAHEWCEALVGDVAEDIYSTDSLR